MRTRTTDRSADATRFVLRLSVITAKRSILFSFSYDVIRRTHGIEFTSPPEIGADLLQAFVPNLSVKTLGSRNVRKEKNGSFSVLVSLVASV